MTILDKTEEEVAKAVLKRLGDMSLREMADAAPVSRGTLNRWQRGDYSMWPKTRRHAVEWLGWSPANSQEPLSEGQEKLIAAKWMDLMATRLREEALANQPNASTAPIDVVARISPPRAKRAKRRSGAKEDR